MNLQNKINLREIYEKILSRHERGYVVNVATLIGNQIVYEKKHLFYSPLIIKKLTGKNPKMLKKWIEWSKK